MIAVGAILLYATLASGVLATIALCFYGRREHTITISPNYVLMPMRAAFVFISTAMCMMVRYFIYGEYSVLYVWQYCSNDLSLLYRIAAVWAGQEGTYLLWAWASVLCVWLVMEEYGFRNSLHRRTELIALAISIFLLVLCIISEPFEPILGRIGYIPADGNGLNPVFITIWMVIHPFTTFISYTATIVPASAAAAHLITGRAGWHRISKQWIRISWFAISVCMATGGVWAYKLTGWNGFWCWDPVQTATLVLWMLTTAVLHILARYHEGRDYTTIAPVSTIFLFIATIYITLVTRQGIFHSFHDFPGTPTAGLLVLGILAGSIVAIGLGIVKFLRTRVATAPKKSIFSSKNTFLLTAGLLAIIAFICFWALTCCFISQHGFGTKIIIPPDFFNIWCYIPVILLTVATGVCMLHNRITDTGMKYLLVLVFVSSFLLAMIPTHKLLDPGSDFYLASSAAVKLLGSISIWSSIPPFAFALGGILYKFVRDLSRTYGRLRLRSTGVNLIHAGFILILLGAIVTTSFDTRASVVYRVDELGTSKEIGDGWSMELSGFNVVQNPDGTWTQIAHLAVYRDGNSYCTGVTRFSRTAQYGDIHDPMIDRSARRDIYVQFHGTRSHISTEAIVPLSVKIVPWISLLWAGCIFMLVGIYCIIMSIYLLVLKKRGLAAETMKR